MKIYLTLDYELFLGSRTGSVKKCLVEPMRQLCAVADKYGIKFTIFVDATYLLALKKYLNHPSIQTDYKNVKEHLLLLQESGHSLQLHVHPHWLYADFNGTDWVNATGFYRLSLLPVKEAVHIINQSKQEMEEILQMEVHAFRAGGFSIQPFEPYAELFGKSGLKIDSSVLHGCSYDSDYQQYDYRNSPKKDRYHFSDNVCVEDVHGRLTEYPIATHLISFWFWWKFAFLKILNGNRHVKMGDGISVETTSQSIFTRLTRSQMGFACMDGYKISLLGKMRNKQEKQFGKNADFVVLGHPKLTTPYSVKVLDEFVNACINRDTFNIL